MFYRSASTQPGTKSGHVFVCKDDGQITQWPKEKGQKEKQRSTKHTHKTKDRVIRTPLKIGGELRCSGRVNSSCSTSDTRRVNLFTNPVIMAKFLREECHHLLVRVKCYLLNMCFYQWLIVPGFYFHKI
jgi:hypothetical protein